MPRNQHDTLFSPAPAVVRDFCLEELYPQFLFRYLAPREAPSDGTELALCGMVYEYSPVNFVVQLDGDRRVSDRISFNMAQFYDTAGRSEAYRVTDEFLHPGVPVAARYMQGEDMRWYRAIIVEIDRTPNKERPILIRFVDFGNYQQNEQSHLRMIPIEFGNEPPLAIRCRLKGTTENDDVPGMVATNFKTWVQKSLKDIRCLVNFCSFDAVANQHIVRVFNAADGQEFLLPPDYQPKQLPPATPDALVGDLINLDLEDGGSKGRQQRQITEPIVDLLGETASAAAAASVTIPQPKGPSPFEEELRSIFGCSSGAADFEKAPNKPTAVENSSTSVAAVAEASVNLTEKNSEKTGVKAYVQTDLSMASSAASGGYSPFDDPQFKRVIEKYPDLMRYLKWPF